MVNRYGATEVLLCLPRCMQDLAEEWYDTLSPDLLQRMDYDVDLWIIGLRARFARHPIVAQEEANRCRFSFAQEDRLDLRSYITRHRQRQLVPSGDSECGGPLR